MVIENSEEVGEKYQAKLELGFKPVNRAKQLKN